MTIEGNKDEAERCIEIAEDALGEGRFDKAEKFLLKAERLNSTKRAQDLLLRARSGMSSGGSAAPEHSQEARRRQAPASKPAQQQSAARDYTVEQQDAVRRINKCKDYYEILGVTKEATDSDVKKAYKKLALQLHPDKNRAPGSAEAFKAIGNAAAVLTDAERRKQYDIRGDEPQQATQAHRHQFYTRGFESDLTAEELFNMFFGASGQHVYARRRYTREPEQRAENHNGLIQLLPVLVLVLLSMMSGLFINDPVYSLSPGAKFPVRRDTMNLQIPYYVKENFHSEYQGSLRRLEMSIEEEFIINLRHSCQREKNYKETMAWKARNFGDSRQLAEVQRMAMPSCERLQKLNGR